MKKSLAFVLSLALTLSLSATAFADNINQDTAEQTGSTNVTYTVNPGYTVTIPEKVTINEAPVTVSANDVITDKGSQVVVKLTATDGTDNAFTVKTAEDAVLNYTVRSGDTVINIGDTVLAVNPDDTTADTLANGSADLTFSLADGETVKYSGTYTGTVTFTIGIEEI